MIKGETLTIQLTDALATAVEFRFGGPQTRTITGTKSGDDWTGTQSTAAWTAGFYEWQAWATYSDASVAVIDRGNFRLESGEFGAEFLDGVDKDGKGKGSGTRTLYTAELPHCMAKSRTTQEVIPIEGNGADVWNRIIN
jgi:hypothetical protein